MLKGKQARVGMDRDEWFAQLTLNNLYSANIFSTSR